VAEFYKRVCNSKVSLSKILFLGVRHSRTLVIAEEEIILRTALVLNTIFLDHFIEKHDVLYVIQGVFDVSRTLL